MKIFYFHILALITIWLFSLEGKAQDNTMFLLRGIPQANSINAANIPEVKAYFGFPALNALHVDYYNSGFALKDILHSGSGTLADSLVWDLNGLSNSLETNNVLFPEVSNTWMSFGFKVKKSFISFGITSKAKAKIYYPGSLGDFPQGNYNYANGQTQTLSTSGTIVDAISYNEIALGYAQEVNEKLTVGGRLKYLLGVGNIHVEKFDMEIQTLSNTEMIIKTDAIIHTNMPLNLPVDSANYVYMDSIGFDDNAEMRSVLLDNRGFGVDLGVTYKPIPKLTIGVAINDLGYISWKSYPTTLVSNTEFRYSGIDLSTMFAGGASSSDYWDQLTDSVKNSFKITSTTTKYNSSLQGNFIVSGKYEFRKWLDFGSILRSQFYHGRLYPTVGLAVGMSPSRLFSSSISYSFRKGSYNNLGVGIVFKPGPLQVYMVTDNLPYAFALQNAKALNIKFGINFVIGSNPEKHLARQKAKENKSKEIGDKAPTIINEAEPATKTQAN